MSEIQNNGNEQLSKEEDNNKNLINNNQSNLVVAQNSEPNIPLINEPFMDPQIKFEISNPQLPINENNKKHSLSCLILVCIGSWFGTFAVSCGCCLLCVWILALIIEANGGFWGDYEDE